MSKPERASRARLKHRNDDDAQPRRADGDSIDHLHPVSGRPPLREYLTQLLERRNFISMQAWSQSITRNRGMVLGNLWLILAPLLDGLTYFLIFGVLLQVSRGMENFFGYLVIGIFMAGFSIRTLNAGANSITTNRGLIRAFTFPRASLPVAAAVRETVSSIPVVITLAGMLIFVPPHAYPSSYWLLFPLIFMIQAVFNLGLGAAFARIVATFPDTAQLLSVFTRLWMYGSAVMFTIDRFDQIEGLGAVVRANPLYQFLVMYRTILLEGEMPDPQLWGTVTAWAVGTCVVGLLFFWHGEVSYGRER